MSKQRFTLSVLLVVALLAPSIILAQPAAPQAAPAPKAPASSVLFVQNAGQWPDAARYPTGGPTPSKDSDGPPPLSLMELASHIGGGTGAVAVQGGYAYIGEGSSLAILDVSDPSRPEVVGNTGPLGYNVNSVAMGAAFAYLADIEGLWIVNVANPVHPTVTGTLNTPGQAYHVAVSGDLALVAGSEGLRIVDVSDPYSPVEIGHYDPPGDYPYVNHVITVGSIAYVSAGSAGLRIVDLTDPANPAEVGSFNPARGVFATAVRGTTAYVAGETLFIVDVGDPAHPVELGRLGNLEAVGVVVRDQIALVTHLVLDAPSMLHIVDVSNPAHPTELGVYRPNLVQGILAMQGTLAFVPAGNQGVHILETADPTALREVGAYSTIEGADKIVLDGSHAFLTGFRMVSTSWLRIVDVSDPVQPVPVGFFTPRSEVPDLAVSCSRAYLAGDGLQILDVSDPSRPIELGFDPQLKSRSIVVIGATAYLLDWSGKLTIVDVGDPGRPAQLGSLAIAEWVGDVAVAGSMAYVTAQDGLHIVNVTNPTRPTQVGFFPMGSPCASGKIAVGHGLAYVACGDRGLRIVDVRDPGHPFRVGVYTETAVVNFTLAAPFVFAINPSGLQAIDVTDPSHPIPLASYARPNIQAVAVTGSFAHLASPVDGLLILSLLRDKVVESVPPGGGSLVSSYGDTVMLFPSGAFTETTTITYRHFLADQDTGDLQGIGHNFEVIALSASTGRPIGLALGHPYSVVVHYTDDEKGPAIEESLGLQFRDGDRWLPEPTSQVHPQADEVTARPEQLGQWTVLGVTLRRHMPLILGG